jgi:HSP20 family protein
MSTMAGTREIARRPGLFGPLGFADAFWPGLHELFGHELRVEERVDDGELVVRVEAPGIDPDKDVEVTIDRDVLTIGVERRAEKREEKEGMTRSEFGYGSFHRTIALPHGAAGDDVKATYADGILEVRMPIAHPAGTARRVEVTRV